MLDRKKWNYAVKKINVDVMETFVLISNEKRKDVSPHIKKNHVFYVLYDTFHIKAQFLLFAFKYFILLPIFSVQF